MSIFISHASEDKELIVRPLAKELSKYSEVWFDEEKIALGDSLTEKINEGLSGTSLAIVVLSESFFKKQWALRELNSLISKMIDSKLKVVPLFYGVTPKWVSQKSPLLSDILGIKVNIDNIIEVSAKILSVIKPEIKTEVVKNKIVSSVAEFNNEEVVFNCNQLELEMKKIFSQAAKKSWFVIEERFGIGGKSPRKLDEIGILLGVSRQRVQQIESKAFNDFKKKYKDHENTRLLVEKIKELFKANFGCMNEGLLVGELLALIESGQSFRPYLLAILRSLGYKLTKHKNESVERFFIDTAFYKVNVISEVVDFVDKYLYNASPESIKLDDLFIETRKKYRAKTKEFDLKKFETLLLGVNTISKSVLENEFEYRFEYLNNTKKCIEKLLFENGEITKLNDLYEMFSSRISDNKKTKKIVGIENIRNQLSEDDRFFSIGKSGSWGLSTWGKTQNKTILDLIQETLNKSSIPLSIDQIYERIKKQRPVSRNSVVIYLNDRGDLFKEFNGFMWGENKRQYSAKYKVKSKVKRSSRRRVQTQQEKVEQFISKKLENSNLELSKLVKLVNAKFGITKASIYGIISKSEKIDKIVDDKGVKYCRLKKQKITFSTDKLPNKYRKKVEDILENSIDVNNIHYAYLDLSSLFEVSVKSLISKCKKMPKYKNATINNDSFKATLNNYIQFIEKENLLRDPAQLKDLQTKRNYIHHFEIGDEDKAKLLIKGAEYYLNSYINRISEIEEVLANL